MMARLYRWITGAKGRPSTELSDLVDHRAEEKRELEQRLEDAQHRLHMLQWQADVYGRGSRVERRSSVNGKEP